jgi:hypothetical protein
MKNNKDTDDGVYDWNLLNCSCPFNPPSLTCTNSLTQLIVVGKLQRYIPLVLSNQMIISPLTFLTEQKSDLLSAPLTYYCCFQVTLRLGDFAHFIFAYFQ